MKTISILTPTRKRPDNVIRMLQSIKETMSGENNIEVIFRYDDTDDTITPEFKERVYQEFITKPTELGTYRMYINFLAGPETFPDLGNLWNECYKVCHGDYVQTGGDDLVYETKDWDKKIVSAFNEYNNEIALVWGNDSTFSNTLATHPFFSRKWVDTIGWIFPPVGLTYANDNFVFDIAVKLGRLHYLCDVSIKHLWTGDPNDPNYGRMGLNHSKDNDWVRGEGQLLIGDCVNKLRSVM